MIEKPCYYDDHECVAENGEECVAGKSWCSCRHGKLSGTHKQHEKDRHKKAVEISKDIVNYLDSKASTVLVGLYEILLKDCPGMIGQLTKIIKKHL
jgi:hypothetical protein